MPLTCREFVEFLMAYVEGELSEAERSTFEGHIGDCPPCGQYLDSYRDTVRLGRELCSDPDLPPEDVPESLVEAVLAARRQR